MKNKLSVVLIVMLAMALCFAMSACNNQDATDQGNTDTPVVEGNTVIRLSTTTSVNDSGLLPYLQPAFEAATGYTLEITSAGTGAAIEKGRTGDADALLVHAKASEEEFIAEGYATERVPFMYNFFVIAGPADDPAGIKDCATAAEAFAKIAESGIKFISRGDDSGTHKAELKIWDAAGINPDPAVDSWYISAGAGMGACITMAEEEQAYVLTDKATFLTNAKDLAILLEQADDMKNTYSMLIVSADKWPDNNIAGAQAFVEWMQSDEAKAMINAYGVEEYGQQLFYTIDE